MRKALLFLAFSLSIFVINTTKASNPIEGDPFPDVVTTGDTAICKGTSVQLYAEGAYGYSWYPDTYLDNSKIANPIATPEESMTYVVVGTGENGVIYTDTVRIEVFAVNVNPSDTTICYGDSLLLIPEIEGNLEGISYSWSPAIGINDAKAANPKVSPQASKQYRLEVKNGQGCIDSDNISVNINAGANLSFEYNLSARCAGAVLEITNTSTNTDAYEWILNGINRSNEYEPTFEVDHRKENRLVLKGNSLSCKDSIVKIIPPYTFDEVLKLNRVNVFSPNGDGINDIFNAGFDGEFIGCASFTIYDRQGVRVFDTNIGQYGWDGRTIDGKKAVEGTYYYIINLAGKEIKGSVYLSR